MAARLLEQDCPHSMASEGRCAAGETLAKFLRDRDTLTLFQGEGIGHSIPQKKLSTISLIAVPPQDGGKRTWIPVRGNDEMCAAKTTNVSLQPLCATIAPSL